jgi:hypothetical protein
MTNPGAAPGSSVVSRDDVAGDGQDVSMSQLYTKSGCPLQRSGNPLHSSSGGYLGSIQARCAGTIDGDRVV